MRVFEEVVCDYCGSIYRPTGPKQGGCSSCRKHLINLTTQTNRDARRYAKFGTYDFVGAGYTLSKKRDKLTQGRLKELVSYSKETGIFVQRITRKGVGNKGKVAGNLMKTGYWTISIDDNSYLAHRLAFLYVEGYLPEGPVDHINRSRADNRWGNIREATTQCNMRNASLLSNNTSGVKGVSWFGRTCRWRSFISVNGKQLHLGFHLEFIDAVQARYDKEVELNWGDCDDHSSALDYLNKHKGD